MPLTQDGWKEPVSNEVCKDCGREYKLEGEYDIREKTGFCPECESEKDFCMDCGELLETDMEQAWGRCEKCNEEEE